MAHDLSMLEAVGAGLLQGVAIVFPISGLGHGVLAGSLGHDAGADLAPAHAGYLYAYLRVGVGLALLGYFWRDWLRVLRGALSVVAPRRTDPSQRRWAGLVLLAVVPGCIGIAIVDPHARPLTRHPMLAAGCLAGTGLLMLAVWWRSRRAPGIGGLSGTHRAPLTRHEDAEAFAVESSSLRAPRMLLLGLLPIASVVPGVSGMGLTVAAALLWGLTNEQAARLALLVLTPVLLTWGGRDLPDLSAAEYDGVRSAVLVSSLVALVAAYLATAILVRYFRVASLRPFGYYCVLAGLASLIALSQ